jgi:hypothetical protein
MAVQGFYKDILAQRCCSPKYLEAARPATDSVIVRSRPDPDAFIDRGSGAKIRAQYKAVQGDRLAAVG